MFLAYLSRPNIETLKVNILCPHFNFNSYFYFSHYFTIRLSSFTINIHIPIIFRLQIMSITLFFLLFLILSTDLRDSFHFFAYITFILFFWTFFVFFFQKVDFRKVYWTYWVWLENLNNILKLKKHEMRQGDVPLSHKENVQRSNPLWTFSYSLFNLSALSAAIKLFIISSKFPFKKSSIW